MSEAYAVFHGVEIPESLLATELQHHQADSLTHARSLAGRALAARAVLLSQARQLQLTAVPEKNADGQEETADEALIRTLLSVEIQPDEVSEQQVRHVYDATPEGFRSPPLIEASHILFAPAEKTSEAFAEAQQEAEQVLKQLLSRPADFEKTARERSSCPSASEGGSLGQIRPGEVLEAIWDVLGAMQIGQIHKAVVPTPYGWHVLRLDHCEDGQRLPYDYVRPHIAMQLEAKAWTKAAAHYVEDLLAQSRSAPGLSLDEHGTLADGEGGLVQADGVLGAALRDIDLAVSALSEDAKARLAHVAAQEMETCQVMLARVIRLFSAQADDEAWTQLLSKLRDSQAPLEDCLEFIVSHQIAPLRRPLTLIKANPKQKAAL